MVKLKNINKHKGFLNVTQETCKDKGGSVAPVPIQMGKGENLMVYNNFGD